MDRFERLLSTSTRSSRILEIGPGYSPVARKAAGWNTHIVDHTDRAGLRAKYAPFGVPIDQIEEVDTVWNDGPLHLAVPERLHGQFDTIIASHVIEHIPDFVGFLASTRHICRDDGVIALAVPDPRFCFDYFKPHSTTGDVLEAHAQRRTRHSLRSQWHHGAYAATLDGTIAWGAHPVRAPEFMGDFATTVAEARAELEGGPEAEYRDCHAWMFTPAGFSLIMLELDQLGLVDWHIESLHGPEGCEFIVFLRRGRKTITDPGALRARRMELLRAQLVEMREKIDFAVAGGLIPPGPAGTAPAAPDAPGEQDAHLSRIVRGHDERLTALEQSFQRVAGATRPARRLLKALGLA